MITIDDVRELSPYESAQQARLLRIAARDAALGQRRALETAATEHQTRAYTGGWK